MKTFYFRRFILILLFTYSILFLGSWSIVGPLSVRNAAVILLLFIAFLKKEKVEYPAPVKLYFGWLIIYFIANIMSGCASDGQFIKYFITYHITCVVIIYSLPRIIKTQRDALYIIIAISIAYLVNGVLSILQFNNNPVAWGAAMFISPLAESAEYVIDNYGDSQNGFLGRSLIPGINGFVVANGYFICSMLPIVTYKIWNFKQLTFIGKIMIAVFFAIAFYSVFCIQQRMALLMIGFYTVFILLVALPQKYRYISVLLCLVALVYSSSLSFSDDEIGRLAEKSSKERVFDILVLEEFCSDPLRLLFGYDNSVTAIGEHFYFTMGHVTIWDALRRGGVVCFFLYIYLIYKFITHCYIRIKRSLVSNSNYAIAFALAALIYIIYSFTHSSGISSGAILVWISFSLMEICYNNNYKTLYD